MFINTQTTQYIIEPEQDYMYLLLRYPYQIDDHPCEHLEDVLP